MSQAEARNWRWYHYAVSVAAWIFLVSVHAAWVLVPAYLIYAQVRDLRDGVEVVADYSGSRPLMTDTKMDYEKAYRHSYSFRHATSDELISYEIIAIGKDNHGTTKVLKYNPETGAVGPPATWAVVASNARLVIWSGSGLVWSILLFGGFFGLIGRRRRRRKAKVKKPATAGPRAS